MTYKIRIVAEGDIDDEQITTAIIESIKSKIAQVFPNVRTTVEFIAPPVVPI